MKKTATLFALAALVMMPLRLRAQSDAGGDFDAAYPSCEEIGELGYCDGDTVVYCVMGLYDELDCSGRVFHDRGSMSYGTCGLVDCLDDGCYGYGCVVYEGESCALDEPCNLDEDLGCIDNVCTVSQACDPDDFTPSCDGDVYTYCNGFVTEDDCSNAGQVNATCRVPLDHDLSPCLSLVGGPCNAGSSEPIRVRCADGLRCVDGVCEGDLADAGGSAADSAGGSATDAAGGSDVRSGVDAGAADSEAGCGCAAGSYAASPVYALGLGFLALLYRRRRNGFV